MRSGEKSHLKKFSERLQSLYSNWIKRRSREWKDAKLIVVRTPSYYRDDLDSDQESLNFFEWLFGETIHDSYIVLSPTQIYAVCADCSGSADAGLLRSFAEEAKKRVGVDFVVKEKGSGRKMRETVAEMAGGFRGEAAPPGVKEEKKKIAVGFVGEEAPVDESDRWMEWKDVTDAFCDLAGFK